MRILPLVAVTVITALSLAAQAKAEEKESVTPDSAPRQGMNAAKNKVSAKLEKMEMGPILATRQVGKTGGARAATGNLPSLTQFEAWSSFTVPPSGVLKLTSTADYTGADQLAVAIECPNGTSLKNVVITVWWGNTLANLLTLTDVIPGSSFVLSNMGGGTTPVYGSQVLLQVVNTGAVAVSCDQVTAYAVVH